MNVYLCWVFPVMFATFSNNVRYAQATPHLSTKRKSLHGRKLRPKSVVDSVEGLSADDIPDLLPSLPKSAEGRYITTYKLASNSLARAIKFQASIQRCPGLKSFLWHWLLWLRFFTVFLNPVPPSRQMRGKYLKLGHGHFLPHLFQFIIHHYPVIYTIQSELLKAFSNKLQISPNKPTKSYIY
jgi:hypothetical protein